MNNHPNDTPAEALARKMLKPIVLGAVAVFALVVFASGTDGSPATPTPVAAPTIAAPAPAPAPAEDSTVVAVLKLAWRDVSASDRRTIAAAWRDAEGDPAARGIIAEMFAAAMADSGLTVTEADATTFLDWAADQ